MLMYSVINGKFAWVSSYKIMVTHIYDSITYSTNLGGRKLWQITAQRHFNEKTLLDWLLGTANQL